MHNKNHLSNEEIYEALMESERTLRQVIDLVPNLIFAKDKNGKFILVNKAVAEVYGKKVEDLIDRHEGDFTRYEEETRHFRKDDLEVINSGKAKFIPEETITDYRGNLRYIQTTKIPFIAGQKPAILGVSVDITDIKKIQDRLEGSRNFLNRIINTVTDPIFVKDENHKWIILNDAFCEFMGYSREELIGKSDYDFFPEHEAKVFWDKDDLVFTNDIEDENEEDFTDSSGNLHVILTKKAVLKDSMTGKKILVGVIRDITDRKKAENDLYAEKEQLSVTLESIGDCVITTDAEGNIALMNRVAENLTGWSHEEASLLPVGKIFNIINQENLQISTNPVDEVIKSRKIFEFPIHTLLITRNNMEKIITGSAAPILDKKGHLIGIVIVFRDITDKHKMEEELLKVQKIESIGLLGGGIAHDFNNFLTSILNNISLAKLSIEPQERNFKILGEAEKVCLKAKNLTQQILTFTRGGAPIKKLCSMEDLLKNSVSFPLSGSSITCEFSVSPEL